jgi:hypothetical protein
MAQDRRDVLDVLRFELNFLLDGGYGRSPRTPWRAPSMFEDSPICPNFSDASHPQPRESCLLGEFVPKALRQEKAACRFIELTKEGQTLEDLYRTGTQVEIEEALANWLRVQIKRIEQERAGLGEQGVAQLGAW